MSLWQITKFFCLRFRFVGQKTVLRRRQTKHQKHPSYKSSALVSLATMNHGRSSSLGQLTWL